MDLNLTDSALLAASQEQVSADVSPDGSGSIVILGLKDGVYYELNETSARIWSLIQHPCTLRGILDTIVSEYDVEMRQCEADVRALIEDMVARGLIEIRDGSSP
jgi:hypothetical protein